MQLTSEIHVILQRNRSNRFSDKEGHNLIVFIWYTKILEVNLFAFAYRLFHRDFSPINGTLTCNVLLIGEKF